MTAGLPDVPAYLASLPNATVLAAVPRRVVRYGPAPDGQLRPASAPIVAKYYEDDTGGRTFQVMQALRGAIDRLGVRSMLAIPRPIAYDPAHRILLQEYVSGEPCGDLLERSAAAAVLGDVGRALATLHALHLPDGVVPGARERPRSLCDHVRDLMRPTPEHLAAALPHTRAPINRILAHLLEADAVWQRDRVDVPVHRDVHVRQLFHERGRVCLIDWDSSARGDAALDVGNLVGYLRARRGVADELVQALLEGYAAVGSRDVLARVPEYEAFTYLRLACKQFRLQPDGWRERCGFLIDTAGRCLGVARAWRS